MATTRVSRRINAPRSEVYRALVDADAVARWRVPSGMTSQVHEFDAREGGRFRVSLTYDAPDAVGKTSGRTDTYHGHFLRMVPDEVVVEVFEFESADPALAGEMTMTTALAAAGDDGAATDVVIVHEGLPNSVAPDDNELGTRIALDNLARLVESGGPAD